MGDALREAVRLVPDRVALVEGVPEHSARRRWSYRQLLEDAERVAGALLTRFAPGDRIAIFAGNCPEWILVEYGAALAGMILVPINPAYEVQELATILQGAEVACLFYADTYRNRPLLPVIEAARVIVTEPPEIISFDSWSSFIANEPGAVPLPDVGADQTVLIQFTSGTTGKPKGALLHHLGIMNSARFVAERAEFPSGGVWINAMPLFHIAGSVVTLLGTLSAHGTYVLAPAFEAGLMLELFESERGNASLIVPTMIIAMLEHKDLHQRDLSCVTTILTGAAPVPAALVTRTKAAFGCGLTILFGQTEINGVACQTRLTDATADQAETLGQPLPQTELCIADPQTGEIVPIGHSGEICIRGYQTMRGYYGLEEATRDTIRPDGWLRTGDLAAMDERGYLRITGRLKDLIIRGGMNIYPREIEETLFDHPGVTQVSVVGIEDERWGEIIAAVILPSCVPPPHPNELFEHCRNRLASNKAPTAWFFVGSFPLTPSGKIQKFALIEEIKAGRLTPVPWEKKSSRVTS
ncbi:class I adenylate-forming enzyme family protein [Sphingomonas sp. ID0503]|uniref:class I adenylate-forming enzyme family protein n=1 Tax=Sphingomonas sp. ID0503 TaxID=3399691 RepID=UPI003AFAAB40